MSYTTATDPDGCQAIRTEQYHAVATRDGDVIHIDHAHADEVWSVLTRVLAPDEATWKRLAAAVDDQLEGDALLDGSFAFPDYLGERVAGRVLAALAGTAAQDAEVGE